MPDHPDGTAPAPSPAWQRWVVRAVLAVAMVWATLMVITLAGQFRTEVHYPDDGTVLSGVAHSPGQLAWAVAAGVAALGLGWALLSSFRRRLRRRSWMPVVCLLLVVAMATVVARDFVPPVG
ncbi:hypothetical protein ACPCG0_02795 [Propionibacteriaceae bacterium Y1923]